MENNKIIKKGLSDIMSLSFLAYALSVIQERALPYVKDGLKPVQRRILNSMYELGLTPEKAFRKSARIVGDVLGKYHPHGDQSVYDATVVLAQTFSTRYPLVDGHGNWGSIDGDNAAAMRYTEAKLTKYGYALLDGINKDTVDFVPNFDGTEREPESLPGLIPNLLANGSKGIAVGIATDIQPHNLTEIYDALIFMIDKALAGEEIVLDDILKYIKGPDFPTGATIINQKDLKKIYETGRGSVVVRSNYIIEKNKIIFTELPYRINKSVLIEKIYDLKKNKIIPEISLIRDESDKQGIALAIYLNKDANVNIVLNKLFKKTDLQSKLSFNINVLDENKKPQNYNLLELLDNFISHSAEIITRRINFELEKKLQRMLMVEGVLKATDPTVIDKVLKIITKSEDIIEDLKQFDLTENQINYIINMKVGNLTNTSRQKLTNEKEGLEEEINKNNSILQDNAKLLLKIKEEFIILKEKLGDERRTVILDEHYDIEDEDLLHDESLVIFHTSDDCIKSVSLEEYKTQNRGGKGVKSGSDQDECIKNIINANNKDHLLFFTDSGRCIVLKAYKIQKSSRTARAKSIINYINLEPEEKVISIINLDDKEQDQFLMLITKKGVIKKISTEQLSNTHSSTRVMNFKDNDQLKQVLVGKNNEDILITTKNGMGLRINIDSIRSQGRTAMGVKGITLKDNDEVIDMTLACDSKMLLTVTDNGYGKKTNFNEFTAHNRGGKGMISHKITDKTGTIASVCSVTDQNELLIATNSQLVRVRIDSISLMSRGTQGIKLINLNKDDKVVSSTIVEGEE